MITVAIVLDRGDQRFASEFARRIRHLEWAEPDLTRLVRQQAVQEASTLPLAIPAICNELRVWRESSYMAPSGTAEFIMAASALPESADQKIFSVMARSMSRGNEVLERVKARYERNERTLASITSTYARLLAGRLGLQR